MPFSTIGTIIFIRRIMVLLGCWMIFTDLILCLKHGWRSFNTGMWMKRPGTGTRKLGWRRSGRVKTFIHVLGERLPDARLQGRDHASTIRVDSDRISELCMLTHTPWFALTRISIISCVILSRAPQTQVVLDHTQTPSSFANPFHPGQINTGNHVGTSIAQTFQASQNISK